MELNYFPINIEFDNYQIAVEPYTNERLVELRKLYNATHSFFRNDDFIYISNKDGDANQGLGKFENRSVFENDKVTSSLIKHIFFRTFKDRFPNYTPIDFYPFRFFSKNVKDDIIYSSLPQDFKGKIAYKKLIELQLRLTEINGKKRFGFIINIKRNWIFNKNCAELYSEGYNLIGIEVLHSEPLPGLKKILAPNEEFIGIVKEISGQTATVETSDGLIKYELKELFIKKTKFNIGNYLAFAISQTESNRILKIIENRRAEIYNAKTLYNEILKIAKHLFYEGETPILFQNKDGFCFTIEQQPLKVSNTINLKTPVFIFDYAGTKTSKLYPDIGLNNFGPYDSLNFDIKSPSVLCICNGANRGYFTKFLSSLKDGLPNSKYFKKGFLKKYDLQGVTFNVRQIKEFELEHYLEVIKNYDENKPDLAIIEIPAEFKNNLEKAKIYYSIKAKLLSLEIPVQFITTEKLRNYDEYLLNSISLQLYAKLGGTPWVLPSQRSVDRELIIGIGHSLLRRNQYKGAEQSKVVGITTFLSSDGQYLLGDKVKDVPYDNYFDELLKSLKQSINKLSTEQGWSQGDTVRLIFHIFKPIKNIEFDVVNKLIKDISDYKIKFAFVTIGKSHPNLLFDSNQKGVVKYGRHKGEFISDRGSNIFLDSETCLIQMLGVKELKSLKHGMSHPIQIKIRIPQGKYNNNDLDEMLFYDLSYISQQVFLFTNLSWRSFLPGEQPATMLYSNLISKLLSKMKNIEGWDPDYLNYGLKRKKWFL